MDNSDSFITLSDDWFGNFDAIATEITEGGYTPPATITDYDLKMLSILY